MCFGFKKRIVFKTVFYVLIVAISINMAVQRAHPAQNYLRPLSTGVHADSPGTSLTLREKELIRYGVYTDAELVKVRGLYKSFKSGRALTPFTPYEKVFIWQYMILMKLHNPQLDLFGNRDPEPTLFEKIDPEIRRLAIDHEIDGLYIGYSWDDKIRYQDKANSISGSVRINTGDRVLDIGCGRGNVIIDLARLHRDAEFVGIDANPFNISKAIDLLASLGNQAPQNVKLHIRDVRASGFDAEMPNKGILYADGYFDIVMLLEGVMDEDTYHKSWYGFVWKETIRVARKPGAMIVFFGLKGEGVLHRLLPEGIDIKPKNAYFLMSGVRHKYYYPFWGRSEYRSEGTGLCVWELVEKKPAPKALLAAVASAEEKPTGPRQLSLFDKSVKASSAGTIATDESRDRILEAATLVREDLGATLIEKSSSAGSLQDNLGDAEGKAISPLLKAKSAGKNESMVELGAGLAQIEPPARNKSETLLRRTAKQRERYLVSKRGNLFSEIRLQASHIDLMDFTAYERAKYRAIEKHAHRHKDNVLADESPEAEQFRLRVAEMDERARDTLRRNLARHKRFDELPAERFPRLISVPYLVPGQRIETEDCTLILHRSSEYLNYDPARWDNQYFFEIRREGFFMCRFFFSVVANSDGAVYIEPIILLSDILNLRNIYETAAMEWLWQQAYDNHGLLQIYLVREEDIDIIPYVFEEYRICTRPAIDSRTIILLKQYNYDPKVLFRSSSRHFQVLVQARPKSPNLRGLLEQFREGSQQSAADSAHNLEPSPAVLAILDSSA